MFIWGLVMAKAKTGFSASGSKDKESVGQAFKKLLGMVALISVATLAKLNADNKYIENFVGSSNSQPVLKQGRYLKSKIHGINFP